MQQNVTTGLGGDLCGLLAKQTDEGNLSCGLRFAEQGGGAAAPTIVSDASHLSRHSRHEETRGVDRRGDTEREGGAENGDVTTAKGRDDALKGEADEIPLKYQTFTAAADHRI